MQTLRMRDGQGRDWSTELGDQPFDLGPARFERRGDEIWVVAIGAGVVRVNGRDVTEHALEHNDVIQCGDVWARYVEDDSSSPSFPHTTIAGDRPEMTITPPASLAGAVIITPAGPDASPPGRKV